MKRGFYFLFSVLLSFSFSSCGNKSNNETGTTESDSILIVDREGDRADYYGIYKGTIPVAASEGSSFESTLVLNDDNTFALHAADEKGEFDEQGNYAVAEGIVTLFLTDRKPAYYKLEEESKLRILNDKKEPFSKDETYVLKQVEKFEE